MSKLNPQKATAYVGPGVLRKGGKITPVPNGPLVKKKGSYAGSTLKVGGVIKKAANGTTTTKTTIRPGATTDSTAYFDKKAKDLNLSSSFKYFKEDFKGGKKDSDLSIKALYNKHRQSIKGTTGKDANGYPIKKKAKTGAMIKRADGSMSRRGLWDNIRANKGSGKKPTKQMLVQEKKIKAKTKK